MKNDTGKTDTGRTPEVSLVIPLHNEEESISWVFEELREIMDQSSLNWEVVYIDDGSTDRTREILRSLAGRADNIRIICLNRNYGQAIATMAGMNNSIGRIVVVMDGDGQHDPRDVIRLVDKMKEGYDLVSGWREDRHKVDPFLSRRLPSLVANKMLKMVSGLEIHDFGTSLKAYRRHILPKLRISDGLHRFIPLLAARHTDRITELAIKSRARKKGVSKYGISRTSAVLFDIFTAWFITHYSHAPLRFLGKLGLFLATVSLGGIGVLSLLWLLHGFDMVENRGVLILLVFLGILALQFFCTGFIGEMIAQSMRETREDKAYLVAEVIEKSQ